MKIMKRKDEGFTLIELMIVIAVIGILALVIVPKVGTIKAQAKSVGIDTNMRIVEGYIQSRITNWVDSGIPASVVATNIHDQFSGIATNDSSNAIKNPFTGVIAIPDNSDTPSAGPLSVLTTTTGEDTTASSTTLKGLVVVAPIETNGKITSIKIYEHDNLGTIMADKTIEIKS